MDNETRHLDMRGARVPGAAPAPPAAPAAPVPPAPTGVPTSYLPAMPQPAPAAAPANPGYAAPPAANPAYAPPVMNAGYAPPAPNPAYAAPASKEAPPPAYGSAPAQPGYAPPAANGGYGNAYNYNYNVPPPAPGYGPAYAPPAGAPPYAPLPSGPVPGATYGQTYSYNAPAPPVGVPVRRRPDSIWPFVLLGLGLFFFSGSLHLSVGAAIPLAIGLIFLYAARQNPRPGARRGLEIPGYLLTGLGAGVLLDATTRFGPDGFAALGLGLGFAALWLRDRTQWWWLIPGAVVGLAGLDDVLNSSYRGGGILLPLALLIFGLAFLTRRRGQAQA
jgi:hypothetical protein